MVYNSWYRVDRKFSHPHLISKVMISNDSIIIKDGFSSFGPYCIKNGIFHSYFLYWVICYCAISYGLYPHTFYIYDQYERAGNNEICTVQDTHVYFKKKKKITNHNVEKSFSVGGILITLSLCENFRHLKAPAFITKMILDGTQKISKRNILLFFEIFSEKYLWWNFSILKKKEKFISFGYIYRFVSLNFNLMYVKNLSNYRVEPPRKVGR